MIPASLVLLGAAVVIADVIAVAVFVLRWERRGASSHEPQASPAVMETANPGATAQPATREQPAAPGQPAPSEQAHARADVFSG